MGHLSQSPVLYLSLERRGFIPYILVRVVLLKPVRNSSDGSIGDRPNKEVSAYGFSIFFFTTHFGHASSDGHDDACGVAGGGAGVLYSTSVAGLPQRLGKPMALGRGGLSGPVAPGDRPADSQAY